MCTVPLYKSGQVGSSTDLASKQNSFSVAFSSGSAPISDFLLSSAEEATPSSWKTKWMMKPFRCVTFKVWWTVMCVDVCVDVMCVYVRTERRCSPACWSCRVCRFCPPSDSTHWCTASAFPEGDTCSTWVYTHAQTYTYSYTHSEDLRARGRKYWGHQDFAATALLCWIWMSGCFLICR